MAETPLKRQRENNQTEDEEEIKRYRCYNHIISLLEADEDEPNQDLSSLMTTLQQELSSAPSSEPAPEAHTNQPTHSALYNLNSSSAAATVENSKDGQAEKGTEITHILEASDDELGFPQGDIRVSEAEDESINPESTGLSWYFDGLWEFEDVAANYYTLVQSELFL
ncbi:PREDICTED: uncharacterized protein LOC104586775 [Nelumbo nucifera]|uniref:Uncharacterized protein LOC104586775 n=2 Tax=Nelumbo nucifera TaxID=4432 RepID=A0A1U7YQQ8_NELNU|nr:PREDICTED: uncharacterized protein LOC104586775 [Nelumbo nucifera]DAD31206.1 TPA_asm: hypothetical protein HUJ06_010057 [Nelumbo nucifera]